MSVTGFFSRRSNLFLFSFSLSLVLLIGTLDYETGLEIGLYIFYFLPIILVTWYLRPWVGILFSLISASLWFVADFLLPHHTSHFLVPYWNTAMRFTSFLITVIFLSKLRTAFEYQKLLSRMDHLTEVFNRRTFADLARGELERARRYRRTFTVGYMDIDNFKVVNDSFGHKSGDSLLRVVARTIKDNLRRVDVVARFGGDEFVVLLPETGAVPSKVVFSRLMDKLLYTMQMNEWPVTFSFGVVTFNKAPLSVDEMIKKADELMYVAKNDGKNRMKQEVFDE